MHRFAFLFTTVIWILAADAHAAGLESQCRAASLKATAKLEFCYRNTLSKVTGESIGGTKYGHLLSKCLQRYVATWPKLQAKPSLAGTTCDNPRFADNGDGTVTDRLSGLQWEQKTDDGGFHDKDDVYTWSAGGDGYTAGDGTVFTSFLPALVSGCFAGQCDWRLPNAVELLGILTEAYPCTASPCIDPVFGPTAADFHWSSETTVLSTDQATGVDFGNGFATSWVKGNPKPARAVRGGP